MKMYAGLDVGGKRTAVCILDGGGKVVWRGMADTHPKMIDAVLRRFKGELTRHVAIGGSAHMGSPSRRSIKRDDPPNVFRHDGKPRRFWVDLRRQSFVQTSPLVPTLPPRQAHPQTAARRQKRPFNGKA